MHNSFNTAALILISLCASIACQSSPQYAPTTLPPSLNAYESHPAVTSQRASGRAAQARAQDGAVVDELELRIGGLSADSFGTGDGLEVLTRIPFRNPWELQELQSASESLSALSDAAASAAALEAETARCEAAALWLASEAARSQTEQHLSRRRIIETWQQQRDAALLIDPIDAARFTLSTHRQHIDLPQPSPPPPALRPSDSLNLPTGAPLDTSPDTISLLIRTHHPAISAPLQEAAARKHQALAAKATRTPWLKFFDLGWQSLDGPEHIEARLAFSFPLGSESSANEARYDAEADALQAEAAALLLQLHQETSAALTTLNHFASLSPSLQAAEAAASQAEADTLRWAESNHGDPADAAQILDDTQSLRRRILDARLSTALARCALFASSAVELSSWPRLP